MQVKFKWGTKKQIEELMAVRPSITEAEVYFDKEDGSLYVVSFNSKNELKTSFERYIEEQLSI
jgi:hypothetical protein